MFEIIITIFFFIAISVFFYIFINKYFKHQTDVTANQQSFWNNNYVFDNIPQTFPVLGIFGTALGITIGLYKFNEKDIQSSIPTLLEGLKLAFVATILGIIGLIFFQKRVAIFQKKIDNNPNRPKKQTDEISAISELTLAVNNLKIDNEKQIYSLIYAIENELDKKVSKELLKIQTEIIKLKNTTKESGGEISDHLQSLSAGQMKSIEQIVNLQVLTNENRLEISDHLKKLREEQSLTSQKANSNIDQIIKAMSDNNKLTGEKFDEFSELLKQNNTEALVEVMKRTTEQFNAQMNDLINRLVKENFAELNNSVKNLNDWQNQNKVQVQKLTEQFQKTTEMFTISATTLQQVAENTKDLTSDNSKLNVLIQKLNKVMIEDSKFEEIANKLTNTILTLEKTTNSFYETTSKLNDWVKTEKKFKETAQILISKLEEFRDFKSDVWTNYRKEMQVAVDIIKNASKDISNDLDNINKEFYERLNTTLQNLDLCIQRFLTPNRK